MYRYNIEGYSSCFSTVVIIPVLKASNVQYNKLSCPKQRVMLK